MEGPPEQKQADEGVRCLVGRSGSHPGQGWLGGTGCAGVALLSLMFIRSPVGGITVSQAHVYAHSGLCPIWEPQVERVEGH